MTIHLPNSDSEQAFIVAELSSNHAGKLDNALKLIEAAKVAGCDAIKLQSFTPDSMTIDSNRDGFIVKGGTWGGMRLYDLYAKAQTPYAWHKTLFESCKNLGITCFSSPFDERAVDLLESLNCPIYKIASFEITDLPLIKYIANYNKPIIISCGMASLDEIAYAYYTALMNGASQVCLLHCVSAYPTKVSEINLKRIFVMKYLFEADSSTKIGLSDHTLSNLPAIAAYTMGARVFEKHIKLEDTKSLDDSFSLTEKEFKSYVESIRSAEQMMGYDNSANKANFKICLADNNEQDDQQKCKPYENFKRLEDYDQKILDYYNIRDKFTSYLDKMNKYIACYGFGDLEDNGLAKSAFVAQANTVKSPVKKISEQDKNRFFKRSIFAKKTIQKGEVLTEDNTIRLRPNLGMNPRYYPLALGTTAKILINKGMPIKLDLIDHSFGKKL